MTDHDKLADRRFQALASNILVISAFRSKSKVATALGSGSDQVFSDLTAATAAFRQIRSIASVRVPNTSGGDALRKSCKFVKIKLERCALKKSRINPLLPLNARKLSRRFPNSGGANSGTIPVQKYNVSCNDFLSMALPLALMP